MRNSGRLAWVWCLKRAGLTGWGLAGESLLQFAMKDLAGGVARHVVLGDELVGTRPLEASHPLLRPCDEFAFLKGRAVVQHDDGVNALTPFLVGQSDHGDVLDQRVRADQCLNLRRIYVLRS